MPASDASRRQWLLPSLCVFVVEFSSATRCNVMKLWILPTQSVPVWFSWQPTFIILNTTHLVLSYRLDLFYVTHELPPWNRVFRDKPAVPHVAQKFSEFYESLILSAAFTRVHCLLLSWVKWVQSMLTPTDSVRPILGAFAKFQKANISFVMSICPSIRMEQLGSHRRIFK